MKQNYIFQLLCVMCICFTGCTKTSLEDNIHNVNDTMYFPSVGANNWEVKSLSSLGWNESGVQPLKDFLIQKNTKSFMILVNGRIVMEEYFNGHSATDPWQWNSAGKTLVSATTGIAQQENLVNINNKASHYLGTGWTSAPLEKENLITLKNLLSMTSGLDDENNLVVKSNLTYEADAGTRWAYANVFQKLMDVVEKSSKQEFELYFNAKLKNKIGMDGFWSNGVIFKIYHSTTRSMARFGLLALNNGKWNGEQILNETFFKESVSTSQNINPSYGYLWWLNGKGKYMVPGSQVVYPSNLVPSAPNDMYAAMGAEDQRIYVVPSKNIVIVRMGNFADSSRPTFALSGFDYELWTKINAVIM
jgi:CubicO group peptidase (beta-lactamase class C family)